jgi:hypothetical protein
MRRLPDVLGQIESHDFSALLDVASDLKSFHQAVNARPEFHDLLEHLKNKESADAVCDRAHELARWPIDPRDEHPYDAAVATYLLALSMWQEGLAREVAQVVAQSQSWWWADRVASDLFAVNR